MKELLKCENVWKIYNPGTPAEVQALRGVNLEIKKGEMISIMGASGSGKSTLLNIIGALDKPTKGNVIIDGQNIQKMSEHGLAILRREKIGFVFQFFNMIPSLTAFQNVELPMIFDGIPTEQRRSKVFDLLKKVRLEKRAYHRPNELSGGETQRVAIARALANDPMLILADEPTGNLDSKSGKEIMEIFNNLNKEDRTIIVITHDINIAKQTQRIVRIVDGRVLE